MTKRKIRSIEENIDHIMGVNQLFKSLPTNKPEKEVEKSLDNEEKNAVKYFNLKLPKHMHKYVKNLSTETEKSINELLIEAIRTYYKIQ